MTKSKILLLVMVSIISTVIIVSCKKDALVNSQDSVFENTTNITSSVENSPLLIVPIPFYDNKFHFPNDQSFNAVKNEIAARYDEYCAYFNMRNLNFSSYDQISKFESLFDENVTENQLQQLISQNNIILNSYNEVDFKFDMMYQNMLLNLNGEVEIGSLLYVYTNENKSSYRSMEHYRACLVGRDVPLEVINFYNIDSGSRGQKCDKDCRSGFDDGSVCTNRRLRGRLNIKFTASVDLPTCGVDYEAQAESTWLKKVGIIWFRHKASTISVSIDWAVLNGRNGEDDVICNAIPLPNFPLSRTLPNNSQVFLFNKLNCVNGPSVSPGSCLDEEIIEKNNIFKGESKHSGAESGKCGGSLECEIKNCQ